MSTKRLHGTVNVPGDKSMTHRAALFGAIAEGVTEFTTETLGRDNMATIRIMGQLGVTIDGTMPAALLEIAHEEGLRQFTTATDGVARIRVQGVGLDGLRAPEARLDCGNSGTTARLLTGILAAQCFSATLTGDESLSRRPFARVTEPLSRMGARFSGDMLPLTIHGAKQDGKSVSGIQHASKHASAQVKSAILLAGLWSREEILVTEPNLSRDHTERMFSAMGIELERGVDSSGRAFVRMPASSTSKTLRGSKFEIARDFSAAAFFLVAGSIIPGSEILLPGVGVNSTRIGLLHVLKRMGANITLQNERDVCGEPVADIRVRSAELRGVDVTPEDVVLGIDEIPVLALAAAVAQGTTRVSGAAELRVKESDRLATTAKIIRDAGVRVEELPDGMVIEGQSGGQSLLKPPQDAPWRRSGDHRIAMTGAVLDLFVSGGFELQDRAAVETSFPHFSQCLTAAISSAA